MRVGTSIKSMMEQIEVAKSRCKRVISRINTLPRHTNITDSSKRTLHKLALSELNFLSHASSTTPLSINIGHLEAVIHILEQPFITGVSRVCKLVPFSNAITKTVHVDIVCSISKNPVWVIVSDRNPKCVSWVGNDHKGKGLRERLEELLVAARSSHVMKPSSVVLFFSRGVVDSVFEKLRDEFGVCDLELEFSNLDCEFCEELDGEWINVIARSYNEARLMKIDVGDSGNSIFGFKDRPSDLVIDHSELEFVEEQSKLELDKATFHSLVSSMKPWSVAADGNALDVLQNLRGDDDIINFTTTALIALASGISNGCTEKLLATSEIELRLKFKGNLEFVIGQVKSEIENPMLVDCGRAISGKRGIVCETVLSEFKELISMYGGPNEKFRAGELLKRIRIVPDNPSERMMGLPITRNLALKNKIVFGTGDYWHATTLTANMAFVRAVSQTGMSLVTFEHRPRALIGD